MTTVQNVSKSRFGFHACDHETFLKLKKLKKFYFKALRRNGEWNRWSRKEPQNRVEIKWYRNDKGQKTGSEIVGPKVEPKLYPVFGQKRYIPTNDHALNDMGVLAAYDAARRPYATSDEVKAIAITVEQIDNMLSHLEKFDNQ